MAGERINTLHGANIDARDATPVHTLGQVAYGVNDSGAPLKFIYVQAGGSISADDADCAVSATGQLTASGGTYTVTTAFANDQYGWAFDEVN